MLNLRTTSRILTALKINQSKLKWHALNIRFVNFIGIKLTIDFMYCEYIQMQNLFVYQRF